LRLSIKDKAGWKKHDGADKHVTASASYVENTPAEPRNRITNHTQAQKYLKQVLQRDMANIIPAIAISKNGERKAEHVQDPPKQVQDPPEQVQNASNSSKQQARCEQPNYEREHASYKRQQVCCNGNINQ